VKILFTTPTYRPHQSGAELFLEDLIVEFSRMGHHITVLTESQNGTFASEIVDGVRIIRTPYPSSDFRLVRKWPRIAGDSFFLMLRLFRTLLSGNIRTVCIGLVGRESFFILLLSYLIRLKLILFLHGSEIRSYIQISPVIRWSLRRILCRADAVVAVSEELRNEAAAFEPAATKKITVIPCGIHVENIQQQKKYKADRKYIFYAGRVSSQKGVRSLIQAFESVSAVIDLDLWIAGKGPDEDALKQLVKELNVEHRVRFLGFCERPEIFRLMKGCEFVVLPSRSEGCPLTILEALAAQKVTLGSNVAGIREILHHQQNGFLYESDDVNVFAEWLKRLSADPVLRERIERKIAADDLSRYELKTVAKQHAELYLGLRDYLRICLITASYYQDDNCGGISSYYHQLNKSLQELGHKTYLVTSKDNQNGNHAAAFVDTRWNAMTGPEGSPIARLWSRAHFAHQAYRHAARIDRETGLDLIIAPELFAQGIFTSFFLPDKLVTRIHAPTGLVDRYNNRRSFPMFRPFLTLPEKIQAKRSVALTAATNFLSAKVGALWKISPESIQVLPNGIDLHWIRNLAAAGKRELNEEYILYFGRLESLKGIPILSAALPHILEHRPDLRMVFIGRDWGCRENLLRENQEHRHRIMFFDTMAKERLFPWIQHAKLVILPSLFDNFSNAGLEAMALERPVVTTYNTGLSEWIQDGFNGFLVQPGDKVALRNKILESLQRADLPIIGRRAYETVMELDLPKTGTKHIEFCRGILNR
jgi:glycosyltransferase involved in cell wall biosynthesis